MTDKLMEYPKEKRMRCRIPCAAFVQNHFNYQKTADAMYAHVNTHPLPDQPDGEFVGL